MTGVTGAAKALFLNSGLDPWQVLAIMVLIWFVLGCLIDSISIILLTVPVFAPIAVALGYDPIAFAILGILAIETGLLTPPFGMLVFTVKAALPQERRDDRRDLRRLGAVLDLPAGRDRHHRRLPAARHLAAQPDEELSGAGDEGYVVRLCRGLEPRGRVDQGRVPAEGGRERGGEEGAAQAAAAAGDVALAFVVSAVVVDRGETGEGGGFLAADAAEFGHADDERERGALADAGHAETRSRRRARSWWARKAGRCDEFGGAARFRGGRCRPPACAAVARSVDMFEADLEAGDILLDLLEEGQMPGQPARRSSGRWPAP